MSLQLDASSRDGSASSTSTADDDNHSVPTSVVVTAPDAAASAPQPSEAQKARAERSENLPECDDDTTSNVLPGLEGLDEEENSLPVVLGETGNQRSSTSTSAGTVTTKKKSSWIGSCARRYVGGILAIWMAKLALVVVLKRSGVVEPEFRFDEAVAKHTTNLKLVFPQLEQTLLSRLNESIPLAYLTQEKDRPAYKLKNLGGDDNTNPTAHFPVVMVPGFVTSGLEVWGGKECARRHFRQRLWAAFGGARSFLADRDCWAEHMKLDAYTGGDPDGIKVRAASGFEAADYFMGNYWVWGKLIENLADLGYTPSSMAMEPYDWRLAFPMLEERDGYFSRLKSTIENMHKTNGRKVVLTSHSMGALVVHYFFAWVTSRDGGKGGKGWVDRHIHAYVNIAGSHLGVPKATTALISGEMRDTIIMGAMGKMVEQFFGRRLRRDLWLTWGSLWAMLPKGGEALWGIGADMCRERSSSLEDPFCPESGTSPLIALTDTSDLASDRHNEADDDALTADENASGDREDLHRAMHEFASKQYHFTEDTADYLRSHGGGRGPEISGSKFFSLHGNERPSPRTWHDPTRTPLPHAPNMRIYCLYGTGLDTERAYYYRHTNQTHANDPPIILDTTVNNDATNVKTGIRFADGDGSVPLLSLGYLCVDRWTNNKESGLNPSNIPVITREYKHQFEFCVDDPIRSGRYGADHVDILGNVEMTEDFLRIVSNFEATSVSENRIVSDIEEIAKEINAHPKGGIRRRRKRLFA